MTESLVADTPINLLDLVDDAPAPDAAPGLRPRRVYIETYGCQMNVADSELMAGILTHQGYDAAVRPEEADVILINTCAVRERAEERVLGRAATLNGIKKERPDLLLGICGCMAEHLRETLQERAPYVDLIIGPDAYRRLPSLIEQAVRASGDEPAIDVRLDKAETYEGLTPLRREGVNGWITIQRGCDKFCTFCIVPFTRGRERGVAPREILRQARQLVEQGARAVTLLGQTVNSYRYEEVDFADLLKAVAQVEGLERIRFTSPYPVDFTPKLIETMASEPKVCPYIHLPVQSGSDAILSTMRRGHTIGQYRQLVADLRAAIPNLALSTDIIVGFPGESDEDYQKTVELIEEVRYDFA
ncbi:MAG: tRNA (N6-isopentenyl adenosine(37)-C2)-methylthiotransferase MiaB, partial [Myxococcota bacterium]